MKKYLDANLFIYPILKDDEKADKHKRAIYDLASGVYEGVTSILTWDELAFVVRKFLGKDIAIKESAKFLKMPNLIFVDASKNIIRKAQELIETYKLKPRDAIHVATAIFQGCTEFISDDSDFDVIKEIKRISI